MICPQCNTNNPNENAFCLQSGFTFAAITENLVKSSGNYPETPPSFWFGEEAENLSGRTLNGKYQLEVKLGTGGVGAVYLATRLHIGDKVAVKVLRSDKNNDAQTAFGSKREWRRISNIRTPSLFMITV